MSKLEEIEKTGKTEGASEMWKWRKGDKDRGCEIAKMGKCGNREIEQMGT